MSGFNAVCFIANTEFHVHDIADMDKRIWSFDLSAYEEVQTKVSALNPQVVIGQLPKFVLKWNEILFLRFFIMHFFHLQLFSQPISQNVNHMQNS